MNVKNLISDNSTSSSEMKGKKEKQGCCQSFKSLFRKSKGNTKDLNGGDLYFSICDIPPFVDGKYDKYGLFRYLDDVSHAMEVGMDKYVLLTEVDRDHYDFLVESMDLTLRDGIGQTVLHLAAQYLDKEKIEKLVGMGCEVDAKDSKGYTPYFHAVLANNLENMSVLKNLNCNYMYEHELSGRAAIHVAAQYGAMDALKALLEMGMSMDLEDSEGLTPVVIASYYGKSDVCAYLIENGARSDNIDKQGVMGLMRIAASMPTLTREVLDTFVQEDIYQAERSYHLNRVLGESSEAQTSFFHYVIWINNLGILDHPTLQRLVETKWAIFADRKSVFEFLALFVFLTIWTVLYLQPYTNYYIFEFKEDLIYILVGTLAALLHVIRTLQNFRMLSQRSNYMEFLNKLTRDTYHRESDLLHFKEHADYSEVLEHKFGGKSLTVLQDLKASPLVLLDFIVDVMLVTLLAIKLAVFSLDFGEYTEVDAGINDFVSIH